MKINEIIFKHLNGELSPQESVKLKDWLDSDSKNIEKLEELKEIWVKTRNYPKHFNPDVSKALEKVRRNAGVTPGNRILPIGKALKIAVTVALLAGLLGLLRYAYVNTSGKEITVITGPKEVKDFYLPDSTHVWLNANSRFKYPSRFAQKGRIVQLSGEGYFEVRRNTRSPFMVDLQKSVVKVLGTKFNISAYGNSFRTIVTVTQGKVQYSSTESASHSVTLSANERAIFDLSTLTLHKESVTDNNFIAWKTHVLEFHNTPLLEVIKTLSSHFGADYRVINTSNAELPVSALYNKKTLSEIIQSLSVVTDGNIELHNNTIILK